MLDRKLLILTGAGLVLVGFVPGNPLSAMVLFTAGIVLSSIGMAVLDKPEVKVSRLKVKDIFEENYTYNELLDLMNKDEDFARAVKYVYNLSSKDFMAFSRLIIEARYNNDQGVLAILSRQYTRETK